MHMPGATTATRRRQQQRRDLTSPLPPSLSSAVLLHAIVAVALFSSSGGLFSARHGPLLFAHAQRQEAASVGTGTSESPFATTLPSPPPPPTTVQPAATMSASFSSANAAVCAPAWLPGSAVRMRGHPSCALSAGCQRSMCTCLGVGFDAGTATCTTAPTSGSMSSTSSTCANVERCTHDAVSCFQQAAVLTAQSPGCTDFATVLYEHLILGAVGSAAGMQSDCLQLRCAVYNTTARVGERSGFAACPLHNSSTACAVPQTATVHLYLRGESWGVLMTEERRPIFTAALAHDLAQVVGSSARLASIDVVPTTATPGTAGRRQGGDANSTTTSEPRMMDLHARVIVAVDSAVPYVLSRIRPANGSTAWLAGTASAYESTGGVGALTTYVTIGVPAQTPAPPTASVVPPPPPTTMDAVTGGVDFTLPVDGSSSATVGDGANATTGCDRTCQGAIIASVVVVGIVAAGAFVAYRVMRGPAEVAIPHPCHGAEGADAADAADSSPSKQLSMKSPPPTVRSRPPSAPPIRSTRQTATATSSAPASRPPSGHGRASSRELLRQSPPPISTSGDATPTLGGSSSQNLNHSNHSGRASSVQNATGNTNNRRGSETPPVVATSGGVSPIQHRRDQYEVLEIGEDTGGGSSSV